MRKRILTLLLTAVMVFTSLTIPATGAERVRFSDVTDNNTQLAVESLRLMGVLDGYSDGTFRPQGQLTRAQFCKMATYAMTAQAELSRYRTVTVFQDVKPSHWAAPYINLAAKGKGIIAGFGDGKFYPERTVTVGQAVTILLRLLGYSDEDIGGVWPDSYMAVGEQTGLTNGVNANGHAVLTRAQATRLFCNLLKTEKLDGGTMYTLSDETELLTVNGGKGTMTVSDNAAPYTMVNPVASTLLVGIRGQVVLHEGKALTFLPSGGISSGTGSSAGTGGISSGNGAMVVYADRSTLGFEALAGNNNYSIYKNGLPAVVGDLRKYDVATYNPDTNSILVCDTRVSVYYESCEPSPDAPTKIKVLGGTEFYVLPTARDSLADFKPGKQMTLLLTADGQVASAMENTSGAMRGNAVAVVSDMGVVEMRCGAQTIPLSGTAAEEYYGKVVQVSAFQKDALSLTTVSGGVFGDLDISAKKLGGKSLTENVVIFNNGKQTHLSQMTSGIVKKENITYARTNWNGDVDLIVLSSGSDGDVIYGRTTVRRMIINDGEETTTTVTVEVESSMGSTGRIETPLSVKNGVYVAATMKDGKFTSFYELQKLKNVSRNSWTGTVSVLFGGKSYAVAEDVLCYNRDSREWTTLEKALAYADTATLYVKDGVVHVVEVEH